MTEQNPRRRGWKWPGSLQQAASGLWQAGARPPHPALHPGLVAAAEELIGDAAEILAEYIALSESGGDPA